MFMRTRIRERNEMKNSFEVRGDLVAIFLNRRDGSVLEAIIDRADLERAKAFRLKWGPQWCPKTKSFYVVGQRNTVFIHRWLTSCPEGLEVDHINHDTLDNTRKNLRIVSCLENKQNLKGNSRNKSGFRGVHWNKACRKWRVQVAVNGKNIDFGLFDSLERAAEVAHQARVKLMPCYVS